MGLTLAEAILELKAIASRIDRARLFVIDNPDLQKMFDIIDDIENVEQIESTCVECRKPIDISDDPHVWVENKGLYCAGCFFYCFETPSEGVA